MFRNILKKIKNKKTKQYIHDNKYDKNNMCLLLDFVNISEIFDKYNNMDIHMIFNSIDVDSEEYKLILKKFYAIFLLTIDKNIINEFINYINICGFKYIIKENKDSYYIILNGTIENFNNSLKTKFIYSIQDEYHYIVKIILKCIYKLPFIYFKKNEYINITDFDTYRNEMLNYINHDTIEIDNKKYYIINNTIVNRIAINIKYVFSKIDLLNVFSFVEENSTNVISFLYVIFNSDKYSELNNYIYKKYYMIRGYQIEETIEIIDEDITEFEDIFKSVCDVNIFEETDYNKEN